MDAFEFKKRTLFLWKQKLKTREGNLESLNNLSRLTKTKRKRDWPLEVIAEIKRLRWFHPNLGKEKLYSELKYFCDQKKLVCPKPKTIGRLINDLGGLRFILKRFLTLAKLNQLNDKK